MRWLDYKLLMSVPPKQKPEPADKQRERGYYYDDAHGYERYDPEADDDDSGGGALDVDLDGTPSLLIEPEEAEKEP